jgi:hypothetical protein
MLTATLLLLSVTVVACGKAKEGEEKTLSRSPASVRGWVADIRTSPTNYAVVKPLSDAALRGDLFSRTNIYVDKWDFASGGISADGSFILLDVPPGNARIMFQVPGYPDAALQLEGIPENADVLVPGLIIAPDGTRPADPKLVKVRVPGDKSRATGKFATVGGARVEVRETPLEQMTDRREYPEPGAAAAAPKPLAVVK